LSRFRPDSELSAINHTSSTDISLSGLMWEVLSAADEARTLTEGRGPKTIERITR
jgi:thiamine biosynthesis lipoprotein ApbE